MTGLKGIAKVTGKVGLALLGGLLFPIMVWVALGVATSEKMKAGRTVTPSLAEILAGATK